MHAARFVKEKAYLLGEVASERDDPHRRF